MGIRLLLIVYVFCVNAACAQKVKEYPVKVGEIPGEVLPPEAMYLLPGFTPGTASFKNGTMSTVRFNYNFLLDEMHFLGQKGDTLAVADPVNIDSITIDSMRFYFDKGYVQEINKRGDYKLGVRRAMIQISDKTKGGYDVASGISSIKTFGSVGGSNSQVYHLEAKKDVLFREVISYYIANRYNHFLKADKKSFFIFFGEKPATYQQQHKVNFYNEKDLEALLQFCAD